MKTLFKVTEQEVYANTKGEEVIRRQWYAWINYDENNDFYEANPSGDNFTCAVSTLKRKGFKHVKTQYFYQNDNNDSVEFPDMNKCPI